MGESAEDFGQRLLRAFEELAAQRTRRAEVTRKFLIDMAARPRDAGEAARACAAFEKHAAQRTRRAEVAREFFFDVAARPARACAAFQELAQNGPRPALPHREFVVSMAPRDSRPLGAFLPAWILRSMQTFGKDSIVLELTLYFLCPGSEEDGWNEERIAELVALFEPVQKCLIEELLRAMVLQIRSQNGGDAANLSSQGCTRLEQRRYTWCTRG